MTELEEEHIAHGLLPHISGLHLTYVCCMCYFTNLFLDFMEADSSKQLYRTLTGERRGRARGEGIRITSYI